MSFFLIFRPLVLLSWRRFPSQNPCSFSIGSCAASGGPPFYCVFLLFAFIAALSAGASPPGPQKMTGLIGEKGGFFEELSAFNAKLGAVPLLRRTGLLCLKACAWGGYRYGRWRSARARRVDESCGAVR